MKKIASLCFAFMLLYSALLSAETIAPENINVIQLPDSSPFDSDFGEEVSQNLISHIYSAKMNKQSPVLMGTEKNWQPLSAFSGESVDGISAFSIELSADRFIKATLTIEGIEKTSLYANGLKHAGSGNAYELSLVNAEHSLLVLAKGIASWEDVAFSLKMEEQEAAVTFAESGMKSRLTAKKMYDSQTIGNLHMSPDGEHMVWTKTHYTDAGGDKAISLTELVEVDSQRVLYRWQGMSPSSLSWSPDSSRLLYISSGEVFEFNRKSFTLRTVAKDLSGASNFKWLDNSNVIFSWLQTDESQGNKAKRYLALEDRWSYWRNNTQIYHLDVASGMIVQLTKGEQSHSLADLNAKAGKVLAVRSVVDYTKPPHFAVELVEIDIASKEISLLTMHHGSMSNALYADEGIYLVAGPSFSDRIGSTIGDDGLDNDYDGQLYHLSNDGQVTPLSKSFDPAISSLTKISNNDLLVTAVNQDRRQLFVFDSDKSEFEPVSNNLDVIESASVSMERRPVIVMSGTTATNPQQILMQQIGKKAKVLVDSATDAYANTVFSQINDWDFTTEEGQVIDGRYYLPPNFDETKQYPAIVYYYGGTSPVSRSFTGRWPFSLWAAKGYVVYVMQPTGTFGYGQEFSSKHVNAWGLQTADDIIDSTKAFLEEHSFVDPSKVANMGASYGGFMTMYLATKTDLFAASISHAGISNLAEYWGFGWWGYAYSGIATQGKFPWNATDFYTEQSPLFQADQITTPMLLIHGDSDTNVPPSQSHQMYTALKILGKDVELVEFIGEDHTINTRESRLAWWDTILSYLDYKLKDQPLWWETLYPEP